MESESPTLRANILVLWKLTVEYPEDLCLRTFVISIILLILLFLCNAKQYWLFLYADDSFLFYQHKDLKETGRNLNKNNSDVCNWFVDNKLSVHFGEDKSKCILFGTEHRLIKSVVLILNIVRYALQPFYAGQLWTKNFQVAVFIESHASLQSWKS